MLFLLFPIVYLRTECSEKNFFEGKIVKKGRDRERKEVGESGEEGGRKEGQARDTSESHSILCVT